MSCNRLSKAIITATLCCSLVGVAYVDNTNKKLEETILESNELKEVNKALEQELNQTVLECEEQKKELHKKHNVSRGQINKQVIFNTNDLRHKSNISYESLHRRLSKNGGRLANNTQDFINAEEEYGINAIFLSSLAIQESYWGKSNASVNNNNIFGWGKGKIYFSSKTECINTVAKSISENYLTAGGKFHNGFSLEEMSQIYCEGDPVWVKNIKLIGNKTLNEAV